MNNSQITNDPYFQIHEFSVPIKGLKENCSVLHISDLHISHSESYSTDLQKEKVAKQKAAWEPVRKDFAKHYGDDISEPHLLDPEDGLWHIVDLVNSSNADAVILSGDMIEDYSEENLHYLESALVKFNIPWMWVVGNHEIGHEDKYIHMMRGDPEKQIMSIGEIKFIGINNSRKNVSAEQLDFIKKESRDCVPVLVMHIPVKTEYNAEKTSIFGEYFLLGTGNVDADLEKFIEYLTGNNNIEAILCGHVHGENISEFKPGHIQYCASSCMVGSCAYIHFVSE